ncbi:MAG: class I SAM-dependent methyltransferase [Deltaproteobacteria bacterium]|nr:class I SAM-dependent methyltransferase [Deltaproteobacteria bacterium]
MNSKAMEPFGKALLAYFEGDTTAELMIRREDGQESTLPVSLFFRDPSKFTPIDKAVMDYCRGHILDVGAGTGVHSLVLQGKGLHVTDIDINPHAVNIMKQRGLRDVYCTDVFDFHGGRFDTIFMVGHGIGMVETLAGLKRFLAHAHRLLFDGGQVLLDSLDVRITDNPNDLAYHEANRQAGRYIGEIRMQFEFREKKGPYCGWLHVDADTLKDHAESAGWRYEVVHREESGDYLAMLTRYETV